MGSSSGTNWSPPKVQWTDELTVLRSQLFQLMLDTPRDQEKMDGALFKAYIDEYLQKLSDRVFKTNAIFNRIVKDLEMEDLKKFRQVSRTCYQKSKPLWLKKACVEIRDNRETNNGSLEEFNYFFAECLDNYSSGMTVPVQNFILSLKGPPICSLELEHFTRLCGPYVKSLTVKVSDEATRSKLSADGADQFCETVRTLMENAETVHLHFADRHVNPDKLVTSSRLIKGISVGHRFDKLRRLRLTLDQSIHFSALTKFPSLKELVVEGVYDGNYPGDFPNLLPHLNCARSMQIKRNPEFLSLTKLDTIGVPVYYLQDLIKANYPLQQLALSLHSVVTEVDLADVLNHYGDNLSSLKLLKFKLRLYIPFSRVPLKVSFDFLKELELWGNVLTNLNILKNTPNLMKLKVDYFCFECPYFTGYRSDGRAVFKGDMVQNSTRLLMSVDFSLKKLEEFSTDCKMSTESWNVVTRWMPNLRVLEAPIPNNTVMWNVCDHLDKLEKLRLRFGSDIDDNGIMGGPVVDEYSDRTFSRGIRKLKYLRSFELEVECGKGKVTDKSAKLGFLKLKNLHTLKLGFSSELLTQTMEEKLCIKIGHFRIYRNCSKTCKDGKNQKCCEWAAFKQAWCVD